MILMNDFKAEPPELRKAMLSAAERVIESGWFVLGNEVVSFERQWSYICGVNHVIGVANGMDAIEIAIRALNIGVGDEVITTPMTAFATVLAILRAGAVPVLADINPDSGLLNIDSVVRCLTPKTKAVVLVHLYGQLRDMSNWEKLCIDNDLYLIEDCAQSHLAELNGKFAGAFGEAGAYSFYPTKNLGAIGDAGALITNNEILAERASKLRNYGQSIRYHHPELGMNSRLDEIHAAMLSERLKWLASFTERRREIADQYRAGIDNNKISLLAIPEERSAHAYHLFVVKTSERDALQKHLQENDVQSLIHYPVPIHHQNSCKDIRIDPNGLSECELYAAQCLSIPCHPQMTSIDVEKVINTLNSYGTK